MRLMYLSCNPANQGTLMVEDEINEMTMRLSLGPGDRVQSVFLPRCRLEELASRLAQHRPEVLHIAAHGIDDQLMLATAGGEGRRLGGETLAQLLPARDAPRLVYLNACNSQEIGKQLLGKVRHVVSTSTPVTNRASRASAALFYERLADGGTVQEAFDAARALGRTLEHDCEWHLVSAPGTNPAAERLCERFEIVARFAGYPPRANGKGFYDFDVGAIGCPAGTAQVVLFTDESTFELDALDDDESDMAWDMAMIGRHSLDKGTMWFREQWPSDGDFRLYACATTATGEIFTSRSSLVEAVRRCYANTNYRNGTLSRDVIESHLAALLAVDGVSAHVPVTAQKRKPVNPVVGRARVGPKGKATKRAAKKTAKKAAKKPAKKPAR